MLPKQSKDYLFEILENENEDIKKRIYSKYDIWQSTHTTDSFDDFWLEVNRRVARGLLRAFNGASFEEHIHRLIKYNLESPKIKCFWGLDKDKENREKVKFPLYKKTLPHKFDLAIYGHHNKPICLLECKSYLNYFELLGLATLCKLPAFQEMHVFYLTHLLTTWDLEHKLTSFVEEATFSISNFHFFKIGNLLWSGKKGNEFEKRLEYDQTQDFLRICRRLCM